MTELAAEMVMDRSALGHALKPLEREGFLAVSVDPLDKRGRVVAMTATGLTKLSEAKLLWTSAQRQFQTTYGAEMAAALRSMLSIAAAIEFG